MSKNDIICPYCGEETAYYPARCSFCARTIEFNYHDLIRRLKMAVGEINTKAINLITLDMRRADALNEALEHIKKHIQELEEE